MYGKIEIFDGGIFLVEHQTPWCDYGEKPKAAVNKQNIRRILYVRLQYYVILVTIITYITGVNSAIPLLVPGWAITCEF